MWGALSDPTIPFNPSQQNLDIAGDTEELKQVR